MSEEIEPVVTYPRVMHEGTYRLYENADGGLHLVYLPNGETETQHMEIPGAMIALAKQAENGAVSPMQMLKSMAGMLGGGLFR